jgi:hypothetical protein
MAPNRPQTLIGFNVRKRVNRDISTVGRPLPVFPCRLNRSTQHRR